MSMSRTRRLGFTALFAAALAVSGVAAQENPAPVKPGAAAASKAEGKHDPKALAVLANYVEKTGGKAAYQAVKSRHLTATIEFVGQGISGKIDTKQVLPDKVITQTELTGFGAIEQGMVGDIAWTRNPMEGLRLLEGKEFEQFKLQNASEFLALSPEKYFTSIQHIGEGEVDGKKVHRIALEGESGKMVQSYDIESGLMVQMEMSVVTPGGEIPAVSKVSDYRDVNGVKVPFSAVSTVGPMQMKVTFSEIKTNIDFPASTFAVPDDVKALKK